MQMIFLALALLTPQMLDHEDRIPSSGEIVDLCLPLGVVDSESQRCLLIADDLLHLEFFREMFQFIPDEADRKAGQVTIRYGEWLHKRMRNHRRLAQQFIRMYEVYEGEDDPRVAANLETWRKVDDELLRINAYIYLLRAAGIE